MKPRRRSIGNGLSAKPWSASAPGGGPPPNATGAGAPSIKTTVQLVKEAMPVEAVVEKLKRVNPNVGMRRRQMSIDDVGCQLADCVVSHIWRFSMLSSHS
jgi:hypothetical protein